MRKPCVEVWFDHYLLFPYSFVDDLSSEQRKSFETSGIYFILTTDKKRIRRCIIHDNHITIEYENLKTKQIHSITNFDLFDFNIPEEYINLRITSGSYMEISITEKGIEYLQTNSPDVISDYGSVISQKFALSDLIMLSSQNIPTVDSYSIQYIGKSKDVCGRLINHKTIQKITRDLENDDPNSDIMVLACHLSAKFHEQHTFLDNHINICTSNSKWTQISASSSILQMSDILSATEALLIQFFCPKYNDEYKKTLPSKTHKVFETLAQYGINDLNIGLYLYLDGNNTLNLSTDSVSTDSKKMLILSYPIHSLSQINHEKIKVEKVEDWKYDCLQK